MNRKRLEDALIPHIESSFVDRFRQLWFPAAFRIAAPFLPLDGMETAGTGSQVGPVTQTVESAVFPSDPHALNQVIAEFATCLWYLKTKHFRREWGSAETSDDDPRVRRALGRINKSIDILKESGIEVHDPTNRRYPPGGEGMMRPIQFLPKAGLTYEVVSETVSPVIYHGDRLIQRGEVFVAVPEEETGPDGGPTVMPAPSVAVAPGSADPPQSGAESEVSTQPTRTSPVTSEGMPSMGSIYGGGKTAQLEATARQEAQSDSEVAACDPLEPPPEMKGIAAGTLRRSPENTEDDRPGQ